MYGFADLKFIKKLELKIKQHLIGMNVENA
jgi:hypothetical protein